MLPTYCQVNFLRCFVYCRHVLIAFFLPPTLMRATSVTPRAALGYRAVVFSLFHLRVQLVRILPSVYIFRFFSLGKKNLLLLHLPKEPHRRNRRFGSFASAQIGSYANLWGLFPVVRPPSFTSHQSENFPRDIPHVTANVLRCVS